MAIPASRELVPMGLWVAMTAEWRCRGRCVGHDPLSLCLHTTVASGPILHLITFRESIVWLRAQRLICPQCPSLMWIPLLSPPSPHHLSF